MSKFKCVCGQSLSISGNIPNPNEWHIIADDRMETFFEFNKKDYADEAYRQVDMLNEMLNVYVCPNSGHLFIFWDGLDKPATIYEPR